MAKLTWLVGILTAVLVGCGGGGGESAAPTTATVSPPVTQNTLPVANAGVTQNVLSGQKVTLDGSKSSDADGDALTFKWSLIGKPPGSAANLSDLTSAQPTFVADAAGTYGASLIVNDGKDNSASAVVTINVTVGNAAPIANAGKPQNVIVGTITTLDGSASSDADRDPLTFNWVLTSKPAGSYAFLTWFTTAAPTLNPDVTGTYVVTLVVNDGKVSSQPASTTVTAAVANVAPVANAGTAQNVTVGTTVKLDGSKSTDANGDALTYRWTLSIPTGSTAVLSSSTTVTPTFNADVKGVYVASLIVNDGKLDSASATNSITAAGANSAPIANAGPAQQILAGTTVTLDGSASSDADSDKLTYSWTLSPPASSSATLSSSAAVKPSFTADSAGSFVASLVVNDGKVDSAISNVTVTSTPNIVLITPADSFFGGSDTTTSLPYASNGSKSSQSMCSGNSCPTTYEVQAFKLKSIGKRFTIDQVTATNTTPGSRIQPFFNGLVNNQIIEDGQTVPFTLRSPFTGGATVKLVYHFRIVETGATFDYNVTLQTN